MINVSLPKQSRRVELAWLSREKNREQVLLDDKRKKKYPQRNPPGYLIGGPSRTISLETLGNGGDNAG